MTPVQIGKNLIGMMRSETSVNPSEQLEQIVRLNIAANALEANQQASQ